MPPYLYEILPPLQMSQHNPGWFKPLKCRSWEWNILGPDIRNIDTDLLFRKNILTLMRHIENSLYSIYDPLSIKFLHRLQLVSSHLSEFKFKHNFADTVNSLCSCSLEIESTEHYFLLRHNYVTFLTTLVNELNSINRKFITLESDELVRTNLYGDKNFDNDSNLKTLTITINFIKQTQQFEQAVLHWFVILPTGTHVESTSIRCRYYVDTLKTKFRRISTSFPRTFSM